MGIIRRLISFWVVIVMGCFGAYLLLYNTEIIHVNLPGIMQTNMMAGIAFIGAYLLGASTVIFYFCAEFTKRSFENSRLKKKLRQFENSHNAKDLSDLP